MKKLLTILTMSIVAHWHISTLSYAQGQDKPLVDRLETLLKTATDTTRINVLNQLSFELTISNPEKAKATAEEALTLSKKLKFKKGIGESLNNIGLVYYEQGNYDKAVDYYMRSLKLYEKLDDKKSIASSLNNIGIVYDYQGNYDKAIDYYVSSLNRKQKTGRQ